MRYRRAPQPKGRTAMRSEQVRSVRVIGRPEPPCAGGSSRRVDCGPAGRRRRTGGCPPWSRAPLVAHPVLPAGRACRFRPAVHERRPAAPYRAAPTTPPSPTPRPGQTRRSPTPSGSQIRLNLRPGQKGTRRLLAKYGDRLVCVRYRYDPARKRRFKTVEIIVDERAWVPHRARFTDDQIVGLRVAYDEVEIRERVKHAGGTWDRPRRVWRLAYGEAVALGLGERLVAEPPSTGRCPASTGRHLQADAGEAST